MIETDVVINPAVFHSQETSRGTFGSLQSQCPSRGTKNVDRKYYKRGRINKEKKELRRFYLRFL